MVNPHLGDSGLPGLTTRVDQTSRKFLKNNDHIMTKGIRIDDAVVDSGNSPTTKLRGGLALVRVEAAGANQGKYVQIGHASCPAVGDITEAVLLMHDVNMLGKDGVVEDKMASGLVHGHVDKDEVIFGTADAPTIAAIMAALPLVKFEANP